MPKSDFVAGDDDIHRLARLAGVLYLLTIPTTGAWFAISGSLLTGGGATLANLEAGQGMLQLAIVLGSFGHVNHLVLVVVLHRLLSPFGKMAANLALIFLAASVPLSFGAVAQQLELLALLDGRGLAALGADQLQAQITLIANAYTSFFNVQAVFWGVWLLPLGWLLWRSGLVPKVLAVLVLFGGPFYVAAFVGPILDPDYASSLAGSIIGIATGIPEVIGELGTALWLTFAGARRVQRLPAAAAAG